MYNLLHNSKSGMNASQNKIDIISNNIVNVNTTGYKRLEIEFQDLLSESLYKDSYPTNSQNASSGTGVKSSNSFRNFEQGVLKNTEISTNMAIDGEGFFRVTRSDGSYAYTRNGAFNLDSSGKLVDDRGNILDIAFENNYNYNNSNLDASNISINKNGEIFSEDTKIGTVKLYTSTGDNDFLSVGDSLFIPKNTNNMRVESGSNILQGYTEASNVNMQQEITDLMAIQRAFQFNSKGMQVADDMWSMVNNLQSR